MPYFPRNTLNVPDVRSFLDPFISDVVAPGQSGKAAITQTLRYPSFSSFRNGSSGSPVEFSNLYDRAVSYHFYHKKEKIGTRSVRRYSTVFYKDSRGRTRSKRTYRVIQVPVNVRVPVVTRVTPLPGATRNKSKFLSPNNLTYSYTMNTTVPEVIPLYSKSGTGFGSSWYGFGSWSGCGQAAYRFPQAGTSLYNFSVSVGFSGIPTISSVPVNTELSDNALRRLYSRVNSEIPQYLTALGESPQLIQTLTSILKGGVKLFKSLRSLEFIKDLNTVNLDPVKLQRTWLSFTYGVNPVVNDIEDTIRLLAQTERVWRSYRASDTKVARLMPVTPNLINVVEAYDVTTLRETWGVLIEGRLDVNTVSDSVFNKREAIGTLYELIPFSFILDWAVPIGDYLTSCHVFDKLSIKPWCTSSTKRFVGARGSMKIDPGGAVRSITSPQFLTLSEGFAVQRRVVTDIPDLPDIKVTKPVADMKWLTRTLNALFIGSSRTRGFKSPF